MCFIIITKFTVASSHSSKVVGDSVQIVDRLCSIGTLDQRWEVQPRHWEVYQHIQFVSPVPTPTQGHILTYNTLYIGMAVLLAQFQYYFSGSLTWALSDGALNQRPFSRLISTKKSVGYKWVKSANLGQIKISELNIHLIEFFKTNRTKAIIMAVQTLAIVKCLLVVWKPLQVYYQDVW